MPSAKSCSLGVAVEHVGAERGPAGQRLDGGAAAAAFAVERRLPDDRGRDVLEVPLGTSSRADEHPAVVAGVEPHVGLVLARRRAAGGGVVGHVARRRRATLSSRSGARSATAPAIAAGRGVDDGGSRWPRCGQHGLDAEEAGDDGEGDERADEEGAVGELGRDLAAGDEQPGGGAGVAGRLARRLGGRGSAGRAVAARSWSCRHLPVDLGQRRARRGANSRTSPRADGLAQHVLLGALGSTSSSSAVGPVDVVHVDAARRRGPSRRRRR